MKRELIIRADKQYEQVVFCEVVIPDIPNTEGDVSTREETKYLAYEFMRQGYGLDVEHSENDISGDKCYVVESFIARDGDPDFIEGSWVMGIKVTDDQLWQDILDNKINGFSIQGVVFMEDVLYQVASNTTVAGVTEPATDDDHTHEFVAIVGANGQVISGSTSVTDGHSHEITRHTVTDSTEGHSHRFQILEEDHEY